MIEAKNIVVRYRAGGETVTALDSMSLHIGDGEYVAILGPNGSGKSTLLKAFCGLTEIESGSVTVLGEIAAPGSFSETLFGRIGVVFQEPEGQFVMRDVGAEIESVLQNLGIAYDEQRARFDQIVERFELRNLLDQKPERLSGGQMQLVNLACAVAVGARVLLLDEPTTFLDQSWRAKLLLLLDRLHGDGMTIVHVTQYPDEAARSKRVCLLDRGKSIFDGRPDELFRDEENVSRNRLTMPVGLQFERVFGFDAADSDQAIAFAENAACGNFHQMNERARGDIIVSISRVKFAYRSSNFGIAVEDLSLYAGEIVGLVGPTGSGKSTLAFLLAGLLRPDEGQIYVNGRTISEYAASELRRVIGLSWQIADLAMIGPTVEDEVKFGLEGNAADLQGILKLVGLNGFEDRVVDTLSGGEKRKLSLASILAAEPRLLILDEPSAFLDPGSQAELIGILRSIAGQGHGIVIIGHDLHFISELADRVIGMKDGGINFDMASREFFSEPRCLESLGLPPDPVIGFRKLLAERGIELQDGSLDPGKIARHLKCARAI